MNAGIVNLQDGTPCIVYDEKLPHAIKHVEFNEENHQLTLVYALPVAAGRQGYEFDFPLDPAFTAVLRGRGDVAVAYAEKQKIQDVSVFPVKFVSI